jgi:hypothetical protein
MVFGIRVQDLVVQHAHLVDPPPPHPSLKDTHRLFMMAQYFQSEFYQQSPSTLLEILCHHEEAVCVFERGVGRGRMIYRKVGIEVKIIYIPTLFPLW